MGINVGAVETNSARSLATNKFLASSDDNAFAKAAKVGLGDLDISEDGQFLFVTNLHDKRIYQINIAQVIAGTPNATALPAFTVPACSSGETRPWGMGMWGGELYAGVICDASTGSRTDLRGYIQKFNFTSNTWTTVLNFTPTWNRGNSIFTNPGEWEKWEDNYTNFTNTGSLSVHPQPIIGDIEFDEEGSMHLILLDRTGFQLGHRNQEPFSTNLTTATSAGDIMRTYKDPTTGVFTLESAGAAGSYTSAGTGTAQQGQGGPGSNQGPGGGEFYADDFTGNDHGETTVGGAAQIKGSRIIASNHMDPINGTLDASGTLWLSTVNGLETQAYQIFYNAGSPSPDFSKQNGLGDLEYLFDAAPIEVGNRVWNDADGDGIQDPGENPIAGVTVQLLNSGGTVIATATTDANGNYYFSSATGTSTASTIYGVSGLTFNSNYCIRIPNVQGGSKQAALGANTLTVSNADNSDGDIRDSDGTLSGNNAEVCFTTGSAGQNNHTYDFGFGAPSCVKPNAGSDAQVCATTCYDLTGTAPTTGTWTAMAGNPAGATLGATTAGVAQVCFSAAASGTYNFIYNIGTSCEDTVALTVYPQATVGNYVWNDLNGNGLNDEAASAGINGVTVELWNATTNTLVASTTTANNGGNPGYYEFKTCTAGNYYVKFPLTNGASSLTSQTVTAATDNNSDASTSTGQSPVFVLDPNGSAIQKNNPTIDAGYVCVAPAAPTCAPVTLCAGVDATAAVTAAVSPAGGTIVWNTGNATTATSYTYTVTNSCGSTSCNSTITRTAAPAAPTCAPVTLCAGVDATAAVTAAVSPAGGTIVWNTGNATTATSYTYTVTNSCGSTSCNSTITRTAAPAAPTCAPVTLCAGVDATAAVTAAVSPAGGTIVWNTGSATTATSYTYTVTNSCGSTSCNSTITRTAAPAAPTCAPVTLCAGVDATAAVTAAVSPAGGTIVWNTGNATTATSYTYTVTNSCGSTSCNSNITRTAPPSSITCNPVSICTGLDATSLVMSSVSISGGTIVWNTGSATTATSYTYTVTNSCGTASCSNVITRVSLPATPTCAPITICEGLDATAMVQAAVSPAGGTITWNTGNATTATSYVYTLTNSCGSVSCNSTITRTAAAIVGNYVWADSNSNGLQDEPASAGINWAWVTLYKETTPGNYTQVAGVSTANDGSGNPGYYQFKVCEAGNYKVKFPTSQNGMNLTTPNFTPNTDGNSDGDTITGFSPVIILDPNGTPTQKVNNTIDAGYKPASVTSGGGGGIESKTLGTVISQRLYGKAVSNQSQDLAIPTQGFTKSTAVVNGPADLKLSDLVPARVAGTDRALISSPTDLVNFTNALEVLSVDYTRSNINKAVAFGTRTAGDVYSHTKPICDRLRGAELLEVKTLNINGYNVMAYQIRQRTGELEYAMNLNAGVKVGRSSISVQSNWFTDSYVRDETMFNFQLWAVSYEMVGNMAKDIITKLQQTGTVQAVTNSDLPVAYVSKGNRAGTKVNVTVQNNTSNTTGYFEIREKQNEGSVETVRTVPFTVGANKATTIEVPVQDYYEGSMYMYVGGKLTDLLYLSDGTWSLDYNKNNTTISKFEVENELNPQEQAGEYRLMRNVTVQGTSKDYITVYKTMNGGGIEQNLSNYKGLKFTTDATGLGQLNITIVKKGIQNWSDQYSYTINLDGSSKEYAIGLSQFRSSRTPSTPINANDVLAVNFGYNNTRGGNTAASINLSKVRFTTVDVAAQQALQSKTVSIYPNPIQTGVFTASFTSEQEQAVVLRVVEVATGKTVKLQFVEAKKGKNQVQVQLDKATNNGMYSVQVQGDNGNYESQKVMVNRK